MILLASFSPVLFQSIPNRVDNWTIRMTQFCPQLLREALKMAQNRGLVDGIEPEMDIVLPQSESSF
ncbi:hypothetical protein GCM10011517_13240 [Actibacterium pelagium]|uniref:Uncharacterized protein n=1 Tax=Actibacterium pelagium TaxID=2029103 RepID=A0A917AEC4_9RHOB|nr:hypothetical protein GCM10011517_13240 [Actibacterium pelagium]